MNYQWIIFIIQLYLSLFKSKQDDFRLISRFKRNIIVLGDFNSDLSNESNIVIQSMNKIFKSKIVTKLNKNYLNEILQNEKISKFYNSSQSVDKVRSQLQFQIEKSGKHDKSIKDGIYSMNMNIGNYGLKHSNSSDHRLIQAKIKNRGGRINSQINVANWNVMNSAMSQNPFEFESIQDYNSDPILLQIFEVAKSLLQEKITINSIFQNQQKENWDNWVDQFVFAQNNDENSKIIITNDMVNKLSIKEFYSVADKSNIKSWGEFCSSAQIDRLLSDSSNKFYQPDSKYHYLESNHLALLHFILDSLNRLVINLVMLNQVSQKNDTEKQLELIRNEIKINFEQNIDTKNWIKNIQYNNQIINNNESKIKFIIKSFQNKNIDILNLEEATSEFLKDLKNDKYQDQFKNYYTVHQIDELPQGKFGNILIISNKLKLIKKKEIIPRLFLVKLEDDSNNQFYVTSFHLSSGSNEEPRRNQLDELFTLVKNDGMNI